MELIGKLTEIGTNVKLSAEQVDAITKDIDEQMEKQGDRSVHNDRLHRKADELYSIWETIPTTTAALLWLSLLLLTLGPEGGTMPWTDSCPPLSP